MGAIAVVSGLEYSKFLTKEYPQNTTKFIRIGGSGIVMFIRENPNILSVLLLRSEANRRNF